MRFRAEILKGGLENDRELARESLIALIDALNGTDHLRADDKQLELGLAKVQLSDVQITRGKLRAARTALNAAKVNFENARALVTREMAEQLEEVGKQLVQAEKDKDQVSEEPSDIA